MTPSGVHSLPTRLLQITLARAAIDHKSAFRGGLPVRRSAITWLALFPRCAPTRLWALVADVLWHRLVLREDRQPEPALRYQFMEQPVIKCISGYGAP